MLPLYTSKAMVAFCCKRGDHVLKIAHLHLSPLKLISYKYRESLYTHIGHVYIMC